MQDGFLRVAAVAPQVALANVEANCQSIIDALAITSRRGAELTVFPEMSLTGYTCGDLFHSTVLVSGAWKGLTRLRDHCARFGLRCVVGLPVVAGGDMYNCAALIDCGRLTLVAKAHVPTYNEFYERRYWRGLRHGCQVVFATDNGPYVIHGSGHAVDCAGVKVGIEICEDLWVPVPPSSHAAREGAQVLVNLSASPDQIGKYDYLLSLLRQQSARCMAAYVYASAGWGESSTDLVFDGKAIICENGKVLARNRRWDPADNMVLADIDVMALEHDRLHVTSFEGISSPTTPTVEYKQEDIQCSSLELLRPVDPHPFVPSDADSLGERCDEIINIQVAGLARRLYAIRCQSLVVGISGGLDSTLALLVAAKTFDRLGLDRKGIVGVTMPGFGTTDRTHDNALELIRRLGVSSREISIVAAVTQHFADIGHCPEVRDVTYENSQARERTQLLMDLANQLGGIVLGTGDLSELALGWATYNGDQMSMYGVNAGVPKTLVAHLVRYFAKTDESLRGVLTDIADTPISPELIPADSQGNIQQKTEDLVGPYELHDFFLYYMLRYGFEPGRVYRLARAAFAPMQYDDQTILKWMRIFYRRFFQQQFKRSCMPDGPKVGSVCLSPRGDWRMPSDASVDMWIDSLKHL